MSYLQQLKQTFVINFNYLAKKAPDKLVIPIKRKTTWKNIPYLTNPAFQWDHGQQNLTRCLIDAAKAIYGTAGAVPNASPAISYSDFMNAIMINVAHAYQNRQHFSSESKSYKKSEFEIEVIAALRSCEQIAGIPLSIKNQIRALRERIEALPDYSYKSGNKVMTTDDVQSFLRTGRATNLENHFGRDNATLFEYTPSALGIGTIILRQIGEEQLTQDELVKQNELAKQKPVAIVASINNVKDPRL